MEVFNVFSLPPNRVARESIEAILETPYIRMERIVSEGHRSPAGFWYDQPWDEWVMLITGSAALGFENGADETVLGPGDSIHIPAHCRHRVNWTDEGTRTLWLAVHFPPEQAGRSESLPLEDFIGRQR